MYIIQNLTSKDVINALHTTFKYVLLPKTLISDNGRSFLSGEFKTFCSLNKIEHIVTPPYHKQSNGAAEKFIDSLKMFLRKNKHSSSTFDLSIANFCIRHNITPTSTSFRAPIHEILAYTPRTRLTASLESCEKTHQKILENHTGERWQESKATPFGSNTSALPDGTLVHSSRIIPHPANGLKDFETSPNSNAPGAFSHSSTSATNATTADRTPRNSSRLRRPVTRYGIDTDH